MAAGSTRKRNDFKRLELDPGYDATQYVITDFRFDAKFTQRESGGDSLQIWVELPSGDWQWIDDMVNMPPYDPEDPIVNMSFGVTEPWWQPAGLNEALGEDGILSMKLMGWSSYTFHELTLTVEAEPAPVPGPAPVPEPATILLLGAGLICLRGVASFKRS